MRKEKEKGGRRGCGAGREAETLKYAPEKKKKNNSDDNDSKGSESLQETQKPNENRQIKERGGNYNLPKEKKGKQPPNVLPREAECESRMQNVKQREEKVMRHKSSITHAQCPASSTSTGGKYCRTQKESEARRR